MKWIQHWLTQGECWIHYVATILALKEYFIDFEKVNLKECGLDLIFKIGNLWTVSRNIMYIGHSRAVIRQKLWSWNVHNELYDHTILSYIFDKNGFLGTLWTCVHGTYVYTDPNLKGDSLYFYRSNNRKQPSWAEPEITCWRQNIGRQRCRYHAHASWRYCQPH